jgi:hypothetical protein
LFEAFSYFPDLVLNKLTFSSFRSEPYKEIFMPRDSENKRHESDIYLGSVNRRPQLKGMYTTDLYLVSLMNKVGFDVEELRKLYSLTPPSPMSVYKDYFKYHVELPYYSQPSLIDYKSLRRGAKWYTRFVMRSIGNIVPALFDYDQALLFIKRTTSATAFWSEICHDKGEVLDSPEFKLSYFRFVLGYAKGEAFYLPEQAIMKEEIRLTEKIMSQSHRSIIVGALYQLILGHCSELDLNLLCALNWLQYRTGMGMSFFSGNYDDKFKNLENKAVYYFSDISKYDSRQAHFLK